MLRESVIFLIRVKSRWPIILFVCGAIHAACADAPQHGPARLRELAVFPTIPFSSDVHPFISWGKFWIGNNLNLGRAVSESRVEAKRHPEDLDAQLRLAFLLERQHQTNELMEVVRSVEQLCRKRLEVSPYNAALLVGLGESLWHQGKLTESESVLRKSTLVASNDWRSWAGLGVLLEEEAYRSLLKPLYTNDNAQTHMQNYLNFLSSKPNAEDVSRSAEKNTEAVACMERAEELGQKEYGFWIYRAGYSCRSSYRQQILRFSENAPSAQTALQAAQAMFDSQINDLAKAEALRPLDLQLIFMRGYMKWAGWSIYESNVRKAGSLDVATMPEKTSQFIRDAMTRLQNLAPQVDKTNQAAAWEFHGLLGGLVARNANFVPLAEDFRRAVALDPGRETSWDMLLALTGKSASPGEIAELMGARIKANPTTWAHLLFARMLIHEKKWEAARGQIESGLRIDPTNVTLRITKAALSIRQSDNPESLKAAAEDLQIARLLIFRMNGGGDSQARYREAALNACLLSVLSNYPANNEKARSWLNDYLRQNPNDQSAKEIRAALE